MLSVEEAKAILSGHLITANPVEVGITEAYGCILAEDVYSPMDLPSFRQSAVDGYALGGRAEDDQKEFTVLNEIRAGDNYTERISAGQAARIFTGASVPEGAFAVIMQEYVNVHEGKAILSKLPREGEFIRPKASQVKRAELMLKQGMLLGPGPIGLIASLGISKIKVYPPPKVSILITGNEIIAPGNELQPGQVYEANSYSLTAALLQMHITPAYIGMATDDADILYKEVKKCLDCADIILITGGISVGKYDLVYDTLQKAGAKDIFYKVAQKPGKPLYAGKTGHKLIFALPGNPSSVLVCFYEYAYPAIRTWQRLKNVQLQTMQLKISAPVVKNEDRALFMRAKIKDESVTPLDKQDSSTLASFAEADALIYIPNDRKVIDKGEQVEVHLLPQAA